MCGQKDFLYVMYEIDNRDFWLNESAVSHCEFDMWTDKKELVV